MFLATRSFAKGPLLSKNHHHYQGFLKTDKFTFAELNHLNRAGMSTIDTLKSATTISAELCNVSNYLGKLKEGYVADLIVTKNNPIENIKNLENVQMVFKDGIKINDLGLGVSEFTNSYYKRR